MIIKRLRISAMFLVLAMTSLGALAGNIDATAAHALAVDFVRHQAAVESPSFRTPLSGDVRLVHAEPSKVLPGANDYYVFNIRGGGFVIICGEDRGARLLGYSTQGHLDFNNLPYNFKGLLDSYKREIEFLQTYDAPDLVPARSSGTKLKKTFKVDPLIKTNWGQELPYCLQCPVYNGEYCVVGCVATAMAQVMKFWEYPTSCNGVSSYFCYDIGQTVDELPATTFDYSLMLPSYCHWDWDAGALVQDTYTDVQAQEAAKLSRYCGQAVHMGYSPEGSGAYTSDQLAAMKSFGYNADAQYVRKGSAWGWGDDNYTTSEWEGMMKAELNLGRPILYAANDPAAGGHAFICDGYNDEGFFHYNFGWYGTCDGWYVSTALNMVHRDGDELHFNSGHEMLTGVNPPLFCNMTASAVSSDNDVLLLGNKLNLLAREVRFSTSSQTVRLLFALTDADGSIITKSAVVNLSRNKFEQGSDVAGSITLSSSLQQGTYNVALYYYISTPSQIVPVECENGQLNVVGRLAKYGAPFVITDATSLIDAVVNGDDTGVTITDITVLIDYLLNE